jgi:ribonuclease HI
MYCCAHQGKETPCHHFPIYFVDGACANNGQEDAKAGVGIARGIIEEYLSIIPVTDDVDSFPFRSNQRAELLAAYLVLSKIPFQEDLDQESITELQQKHFSEGSDGFRAAIIASDSQYLVKGMTEWLPTWRVGFE